MLPKRDEWGSLPEAFPPQTRRERPRETEPNTIQKASKDEPIEDVGKTSEDQRSGNQNKDQSRGQPEAPKGRTDRRRRQDERKQTSWSSKNPNRGQSENDPDPKNGYFQPLDFPSKTYESSARRLNDLRSEKPARQIDPASSSPNSEVLALSHNGFWRFWTKYGGLGCLFNKFLSFSVKMQKYGAENAATSRIFRTFEFFYDIYTGRNDR